MSSLSIKVEIGGRKYPLTIATKEEEAIRKAAASINANIKNLKENYAVKDMQDLLSMAALQLATELTKEKKSVEFTNLVKDLSEIDNTLDQHLKS